MKRLGYLPSDFQADGPDDAKATSKVNAALFRAVGEQAISEDEFYAFYLDKEGMKGIEQETEIEQQKNELWQLSQRREGGQFQPKNPFSREVDMTTIDVKKPSERFSTKRWGANHPKTGEPVFCQGKAVERPSEQDNAFVGVFAKRAAQKSGLVPGGLNEFETQLFNELAEDHGWVEDGGDTALEIKGPRVKALLDDSTSGGLEITPIVFDEMLITFPLLFAELAPFVNQVVIPRGRRVEGASVGNPTVSWGSADAVEVGLFDTADLVSALDTTIQNVAVAIEIGNDFMSDSPANVGSILTQNVAQRMAAELDKVIALGNVALQPQGIFEASGISVITSENGASGPPTVADYEALLFAVGKQYRQAGSSSVRYLMNDTTYSRARGIAVGSGDQRRVFGLETSTHESYSLLGRPVSIQNDIPNEKIAFGNLNRYRLYRRSGTGVKFSSEGKELMRKNLTLMVARQRCGGRVMDANAFSKMTSAKS
ncbi:phage major capsid protein [Bremerella sp. JC770]|uniref:phage major capsid protein n=1 Tax=Bremerella sp. JC770 TaxID=3232137 RepID=UPI0034599A70